MVFHTGDNGDIWYTPVFGDGHNSGTWTAVPGNFTNLSVSVAQDGHKFKQPIHGVPRVGERPAGVGHLV
jgi:hypothetical protein